MSTVAAPAAIRALIPALLLTALALSLPAVPAVAAAAPAVAQAPDRSDGPDVRLELTQIGPRVVTADGPASLTVVGTVTNDGPTPIDDPVVRVQRGDPLDGADELADALAGQAGTDAVTPQFTPLGGTIEPGQQRPVRLVVPLTGEPTAGLALTRPGTYELLVNVNGAPQGGPRARLAAARLLLPVLSLPAAPPTTPPAGTGPPAPFVLLYPITAEPSRVATVTGEPTLLADDELATSLGSGGRLDGLLDALAAGAPAGSALRAATCVAVDPDLLETATAMAAGYQVRGPDGPVPGGGAAAAAAWLAELADLVRGGCVLALPYADADLVALVRGGAADLAAATISTGREVTAQILDTPVLPDVAWPADGAVDVPTERALGPVVGGSWLLAADTVTGNRRPSGRGVVTITGVDGPGSRAVLTDPLLTAAAAGPVDPAGRDGGPVPSAAPAGHGGPLATQDLLGALVHRATEGRTGTGSTGPAAPLVLAPPHHWNTDGDGAGAVLNTAALLLREGRLTAGSLPDAVVPRSDTESGTESGTGSDVESGSGSDSVSDAPSDVDVVSVMYPATAGGREVPGAVVDAVLGTDAAITDLATAVVGDAVLGIGPDQLVTPLRRGLARPVSAAWRTRPEAADAAAADGAARVAELRGSVRVLAPPSPYSLGTSRAPLQLTVANGLPAAVRVRVEVLPSPGLRVPPVEEQVVPPQGRRQVRVDVEVVRAGRFTVQAAVVSPAGQLLGPPSRLQVRSTAYGTITVWLTGSAGVLLVALVIRRVLRRIRSSRATPPPSPPRTPSASPPIGPTPSDPTPRDPTPRDPTPPDPTPPDPTPRDPTPPGLAPSGLTSPDPARRRTTTGDPFPDPAVRTDRLPSVRTGQGTPGQETPR